VPPNLSKDFMHQLLGLTSPPPSRQAGPSLAPKNELVINPYPFTPALEQALEPLLPRQAKLCEPLFSRCVRYADYTRMLKCHRCLGARQEGIPGVSPGYLSSVVKGTEEWYPRPSRV
jgi:hypothetical protein